jgi:hypothetical protein
MNWCTVYESQKKNTIISIHNIKRLFLKPRRSVYCAVRTGSSACNATWNLGICISTQHLLCDRGKREKTLMERAGRRTFYACTDFLPAVRHSFLANKTEKLNSHCMVCRKLEVVYCPNYVKHTDQLLWQNVNFVTNLTVQNGIPRNMLMSLIY